MNSRLDALKTVVPALSFVVFAAVSQAQEVPVDISKAFSPDTIGPGSTSKLTFVITNFSEVPAEDLAFTDVLPAGVTLADGANGVSGCGGTVDAPDGGTTISFSGGAVGVEQSCEICVNVTSSTIGTHTNTSGVLTSSVGSGGTASDDLTVSSDRPGFYKSFSPSTVGFGRRSTLTFTIDNTANTASATNLRFIDNLPPGIEVASPANASTTCTGGVLTAVPGTSVISYVPGFSGDGSVAAETSCTVTVDVVGNAVGSLVNTSGELTSTPPTGGSERSSGTAAAILTVTNQPLVLTKTFTDDPVAPGGTVTVEFTVLALTREDTTNISFTDDLDAALSGLAPAALQLPLADACGDGSLLDLDGNGDLSLTGGNLAGSQGLDDGSSTCTFSVVLDVPTGAAGGQYTNTTSAITGEADGSPIAGDPASDILSVQTTVLTKAFTPSVVGPGGTTTLEFTLTNLGTSAATDISFSDDLTDFISGVQVLSPFLTDPCGDGSSLFYTVDTTGDVDLFFTGGSLDPGASCTFSIDLLIPEGGVPGTFVNTIDDVRSTVEGETAFGPLASGSLTVAPAPRIQKEFEEPIAPGGTGTLTFTIMLDALAGASATDIAFTDDLNAVLAGLAVTDSLPIADVCGTGSSLGGSVSNLSFTGGSLAPGETCSFSVEVAVPAGTLPGTYENVTSSLTSTVAGVTSTSGGADAELLVTGLTLTKAFSDSVLPGATVDLEFTLTNSHPTATATDIQFSDFLTGVVSGLASTSGSVADVCGSGSLISGTSNLTFSGGTLAAGESCSFSVELQTPANAVPNTYTNTTSGVSARIDGVLFSVPPATDTLFLVEPEEEVTETVPAVTVEQAATQLDPTSQQPIFFTALFSEPVSGLLASEVDVTVPGIAPPLVVLTEVAPNDGTTYEIAVSGIVGEGKVIASIPAGVADGAFFPNNASTSVDNFVELTTERGDVTPPVITLIGSSPVTVECPDIYVDAGATATDDIDGSVPVIVGGDTVDTSTPGTYVITYDAVDSSGNAAVQVTRTVNVVDTTPPVLTLNGAASVTLECGVDSYTELGATALDACEGPITVTIGGDTVDTASLGTYVVTYDAVDAHGNEAVQVTRTVTVEDTTPPEIALVGDAVVCVVQGEPYLEPVPGATATDVCDPDPDITPADANPIDTSSIGEIEITYTATDHVGLTAEVTRTIRVIPRFTTVEGVFGTDKAEIKKDVDISGGEGEKTRHSVASHKDVKVEENSSVSGSVVSVTKKVELKKNVNVDGNVEAGDEVKIEEDAVVGGDVVSGDKVELKKKSTVDGNIDADDEVKVEEDADVGGSVTSGDKIELKKNASVGGDATAADEVKLDDGATVGGTITENAAVPPVPPLPEIPLPDLDFSAGGDDVEVDEDGSESLPAGSYGKVEVKKNGTLTLSSAGSYYLEELKTEEGASIVFVGATIVNVTGKIEFKKGTQMSGADAADILIQCDDNDVKLESDSGGDVSTYLGTFLAPDADIKLEKHASLTGALFGKKVTVEEEASVTGVIALDQIMAAAAVDWMPLLAPLLRGPAVMSIEEWASDYGIGNLSGDEDQDGFANGLEYLLNSDPLQTNLVPEPVMDSASDIVTWTFTLRPGLDLEALGKAVSAVEVSRDLIHWERPEELGLVPSLLEGNNFLEISGRASEGSLYLRMGAED